MLNLAISTSSGQFALILGEDNKVLFDSTEVEQLQGNNELHLILQEGLNICNRKIKDISHIIVDIGPGGTSRVRTGIAFANGLSFSLSIPVSPVTSMELAGLDLWRKYNVPAISTVKSIKGTAYIGYYDGKDVLIKYGLIDEIVPELVSGTNDIVVAGYHREQIINLLSAQGKKVVDSEVLFGSAKILIEDIGLFLDRGLKFPQYPLPVTEKTL